MPRRLCLLLVGTLVLALASSGIALAFALHSERVYKDLITANLEQNDTVHELQIALLRQSEFTAWYYLDDSPGSLNQLGEAQAEFEDRLNRLGNINLEADQIALVQPISEAFGAYVEKREEALSLQRSGQGVKARELLTGEVAEDYSAVYRLCKALGVANDRDIERAMTARRLLAHRITFLLSIFLVILGLAGGLLAWLFLGRIIAPLRRLTEDARAYLGTGLGEAPLDEIPAFQKCLEQLKSSVAQANQRLARSQQQLVNAEKLATVGKLAAGVAHEIRSPLTSLKLRLFSMQRMLVEQPLCEADLRIMTEEIGRLDSIIKNFLEFSRPPELCVQPCDALILIDRTLELLRYKLDAARISLVRQGAVDLPPLRVDPQQMRQVLLNLLNNAIEAQPDGGSIRMDVHCAPDLNQQTFVTLRIGDAGPGIDSMIADRVFDPFFSTKPDGAGLGLWIAQRIMSQHGGRLEIEASGPQGTVFAVLIPVAQERADEYRFGGGRRPERAVGV